MTRHDETVYMRHMLDHAREIRQLLRDYSRNDLASNRVLNLGLTRLFEVLGEAATRVSPETRARSPDVSWRQAIELRNRFIHGYDTVDFRVLWDTAQADLPALIGVLERAIDDRTGGSP